MKKQHISCQTRKEKGKINRRIRGKLTDRQTDKQTATKITI